MRNNDGYNSYLISKILSEMQYSFRHTSRCNRWHTFQYSNYITFFLIFILDHMLSDIYTKSHTFWYSYSIIYFLIFILYYILSDTQTISQSISQIGNFGFTFLFDVTLILCSILLFYLHKTIHWEDWYYWNWWDYCFHHFLHYFTFKFNQLLLHLRACLIHHHFIYHQVLLGA